MNSSDHRPKIIIRLGILFIAVMFATACHHEESVPESYGMRMSCNESFIFFTDPHLSGLSNEHIRAALEQLSSYYHEGDFDFCLCGGDWLNKDESYSEAYQTLDYVTGTADELFSGCYYTVVGNHDSNYQGSSRLSQQVINDLLFGEGKKAYYAFETEKTNWMVFDTGIDWESDMTEYRWEQLEWFASELKANMKQHIMVALHIFCNSSTVQPFAENIMALSETFNRRGTIVLNDESYDFSDVTGKIACFLCGHNHVDIVYDTYSIPVICTTNFMKDKVYTFDLCHLDWKSEKLIMKRIGFGEDRQVNLVI